MVAVLTLNNVDAGDSVAIIEEKIRNLCQPLGNIARIRLVIDDRRSPLSGCAVIEFERHDWPGDSMPPANRAALEDGARIFFVEQAG